MYSRLVFLFAFLAQFYLLDTAAVRGSQYIVGGQKAAFGHDPYLVALTAGEYKTGIRSLFCGGALVTAKSILTAGHCIEVVYNETELISSVRATVGTNSWKSGGQLYEISHNVTHPQYAVTKYDLGFLFTKTCVTLSYLVKPIKVDFDFLEPGVTAKVAGYGFNRTDGDMLDELYELSVTTVDKETCLAMAAQISTDVIDYDIEICTYHSLDHGTCNGDSGSPLIRTDENTLVGVVSWGFPCALGAPDLFTRFSAFKKWIQTNMLECKENKIGGKKLSGVLSLAQKYRDNARKFLGWSRK